MVVDDEPEFTELVAAVAADRGYHVTEICQSDDFTGIYSSDFAVVVLDLTMPGTDGIELIRYLADGTCNAAIILMSGLDTHVLHSARELAIARGLRVLGVLQKPIHLSELDALLAEFEKHPAHTLPRATAPNQFRPHFDELREALARRAIEAHFQPKVSIADGQVYGFEALARWRVAEHGFVSPEVFIALAESSGLIGELSEQILDRVLEQAAAPCLAERGLNIAFNLSPLLLEDIDIPDRLLQRAAEHGVAPTRLTIEITETAVIERFETALDILTRLRMKGFHLSIDDFGTGYSSLVQLKRMPFTELKIDRSFVSASDSDEAARFIVESTVDLGRRLGLEIVAEGVETPQELAMLKALHCDLAQGYLIARPMAPAAIAPWLTEWGKGRAWADLAGV